MNVVSVSFVIRHLCGSDSLWKRFGEGKMALELTGNAWRQSRGGKRSKSRSLGGADMGNPGDEAHRQSPAGWGEQERGPQRRVNVWTRPRKRESPGAELASQWRRQQATPNAICKNTARRGKGRQHALKVMGKNREGTPPRRSPTRLLRSRTPFGATEPSCKSCDGGQPEE